MNLYSLKRVAFLCIIFLFSSCGDKSNREENSLYEIKKSDFINKIAVYGYLEPVNSINITCPRLQSDLTVIYLIPEGTNIKKGDTVCILEAPEIQNVYENSLNALEIAKIQYTKTNENLQLQYLILRSQVSSIEANTKISKLDSLQKKFVSDSEKRIIELEIKKAEIEKQKLEYKLHSLKIINEAELQKMKLRIVQSENNVARAKDILSKLTIISPVDGLAQYALKWGYSKIKEGDIVWDNMPLLNIPDMTKMQAIIKVSEADYKRINPGQKIRMTIDAFPEISFYGKIERKSPAGRPVKRNSPVKIYDIYASVDTLLPDIQPGLSLSCEIIAEELKDTLSIPLTALFEEDTAKYVYLKNKNRYEKLPVEVGPQSSTHIIVSKGLKENDIISLISPYKKL